MSKPDMIPLSMAVKEVADHVTRGDSEYIRHQAFPIVKRRAISWDHHLGRYCQSLDGRCEYRKNRLEAGNDEPVVTYPDELLYDAVGKMLRNDVGRLPVVDRQSPHKLVGYLGRSAVMEARLHRLHEEHVREPGWLKQISLPKQPITSRSGKRSSVPGKDGP